MKYIFLVGDAGSGKTTLCNTIIRLFNGVPLDNGQCQFTINNNQRYQIMKGETVADLFEQYPNIYPDICIQLYNQARMKQYLSQDLMIEKFYDALFIHVNNQSSNDDLEQEFDFVINAQSGEGVEHMFRNVWYWLLD